MRYILIIAIDDKYNIPITVPGISNIKLTNRKYNLILRCLYDFFSIFDYFSIFDDYIRHT